MIRPEYYGKYGELEAARYLQKQGYKLYDVNYRCRFGEIDLICTKGQYLVFVEVKPAVRAPLPTRRNSWTNTSRRGSFKLPSCFWPKIQRKSSPDLM